MKGITPVIAVILLLLITISIVGIAFTFFQRTTQTATESGQRQLEQETSSLGTSLTIENVERNKIVIRNTGISPLTNLAFFAENVPISYTGPASLEPDAADVYTLNDAQLAMAAEPARLKVTSSGLGDEMNANFYIPTGNVAAYYKFDEGSGMQAADSSGKNNNGVLVNGPTWVPGRYGTALHFDGVDDYVEVPYSTSLDITNQITVEAWINLDDVTGNSDQDIIVNKEGIPYEIAVHDAGCDPANTIPKYNYVWYIGGPAGFPNNDCGWRDAGGAVQKGIWTHLLLTYDGSVARVYINGVLQKTFPGSGPIQTTICTLRIGGRGGCPSGGHSTPDSFFKGTIDEVRIMNVARQP